MSDSKPKKLNFTYENKIYIHGLFDESIVEDVIPFFHEMIKKEKDKKEGKIIIEIASCGGYTYILKNLLALVEKAKEEGIIVETRVFSHAYSCGSILAISGTKGHRFVGPYAEHLCHLGSAGTGRVSTDMQLERQTALLKRHFDFVREIYTKYSAIPDLEKAIQDDDFYIAGRELIDWELADKLF